MVKKRRKLDKIIQIGKIRILYHKGIETHILKHENVSIQEAEEALKHGYIRLHLGRKDYAFLTKNPYSGKYMTVFAVRLGGGTYRLKTIRLSTRAEKSYYNKKLRR